MEEKDIVRALGGLAQASRLKVYRALVVSGDGGMTPGGLGEALSLPSATLSFHLKALLHAGLVTQERSGRNLVYRADFSRMSGVLAFLTDNCCEGGACEIAPVAPLRNRRKPKATR